MLKLTQLIGFGAGVSGEIAYFIGGVYNSTEMNGMYFASESAFDVTAVVANNAYNSGGVMSNTRGYAYNGSYYDGILFSSRAATSGGYKFGHRSASAHNYMTTETSYHMGGSNSDYTIHYNDIYKFVFSTSTRSDTGDNISVVRAAAEGADSTTRGYCMGGVSASGTKYNEIDGLIFSGETTFDLSATLSNTRTSGSAFNSPTKGYYAGGDYSTNSFRWTAIDGIIFSSNTMSNPSATLYLGRRWASSTNSLAKAYTVAGDLSTGNTTDVDGFTFSTQTSFNPSVAISPADNRKAEVQTGGII